MRLLPRSVRVVGFAATVSLFCISQTFAQQSYVYVKQDTALVNLVDPVYDSASRLTSSGSTFSAYVRPAGGGNNVNMVWDAATTQFKTIPSGNRTPHVQALQGDTLVGYSTRSSNNNAYVWNTATQTATSLHKTGNTHTSANDFRGNLVVGSRYSYNYNSYTMEYKAVKWNAATTAMTDLDMTGYSTTQALFTDGNVIVGTGTKPGRNADPVLWDAQTGAQRVLNLSGTADNPGDITPASGLSGVDVVGISLNRVVGEGLFYDPYSTTRGYVWDTQTGARTMLETVYDTTYNYVDGVFGKYAYGSSTVSQTATTVAWDITTGKSLSFAGGSNVGTRPVGGYGDTLFGTNYSNSLAYSWDLRTGAYTDLHQAFVPGVAPSSTVYAVSDTGVVLGRANGNSYFGTPAELFALIPFSSTAPAQVGAGQTATNTANFTQTTGTATINGTMRFRDTANNQYTLAGGTLGGTGLLIGNLLNTGGTVNPGNSPGTLTVAGNYGQTAGGTLLIEITGVGAGQFDVLKVNGAATLAGSLSILPSGYTPSVGAFFDVITAAGGISGTFTNITPGWTFTTVSAGKTGRLTFSGAVVVPETGSLCLIALGGVMGIGMMRRRRK